MNRIGIVLVLMGGAFSAGVYVGNQGLDSLEPIGVGSLLRGTTSSPQPGASPETEDGDTIRIASFNIQVFGESKLRKSKVMHVLAAIVRRFDVVAIQEIRAKKQDVLPRFISLINAEGAEYDFVIGPRLGRSVSKEQYAFVYNTRRIEADRNGLYTVDDPDDLLHREPLVVGFRVRGPPVEEALTFSLINIHTDPDETDQELDALDDVYRAVRNDGSGEDDVILLGDLNVDDANLGELGLVSQIVWAISGIPTNTRGTRLYDNILYHQPSTTEFTGRSGVLDVMREFNLTIEEALAVSDHFPVWIELDVLEGGPAGRLASRPRQAQQ